MNEKHFYCSRNEESCRYCGSTDLCDGKHYLPEDFENKDNHTDILLEAFDLWQNDVKRHTWREHLVEVFEAVREYRA